MNTFLRHLLLFLVVLATALVAVSGRADIQPTRSGAQDVVHATAERLQVPPLPRNYVRIQRGALDVAYPPAIETLVRSALNHVDNDARALAEQLGLGDSDIPRLSIRLVPDPETMHRLAPADAPPPAYAVGVAYPGIGLALVSASAPRSWEASDVRKVLRHELSHLLLAVATGHAAVPRWFAEGVAIHQSGEHSYERFKTLAVAAFTGGLVSLRQLDASFAGGPNLVDVAYAESADFVAYLMRAEGEPRFALLLAHLREGMTFEQALRQTYRRSLAQMELEWLDDVRSRFLTAPLWAGSGLLWLVGTGLLVVAYFGRRRQAREILARWAREESVLTTYGLTVFAPSVLSGAVNNERVSVCVTDTAGGEKKTISMMHSAPSVDHGEVNKTTSDNDAAATSQDGKQHRRN